jgi:hypothetical protein
MSMSEVACTATRAFDAEPADRPDEQRQVDDHREFRRAHPQASHPDREQIPVLAVQMPSEPSVIRFYVALLAAMGAPLHATSDIDRSGELSDLNDIAVCQ